MPIHKLETHQADIHYFMLSREVVQAIDNPDALAIWCYLQSKPQNWIVLEDQVRSHFNIGRLKYLKAMRCLRVAGLYRVLRLKDDKNRFCSNVFHIYPYSYLRISVQSEMNTDIKEKEIPKEKESISTEERQLFEDFRLRYSGKKRGLDTELNNFIKKIKDWKKVLPILSTVNLDFDVTEKRYIPHLQTFINQRKWEMMTPGKPKPQPYEEFNWRKK
tara:strand:+ start:125 stop:775 length:651 start_codon:yes stop_codon:yes gene_type:complete